MVDKILHGTSGNDELWGNSYQSPDVYVEPFEEYYAKVYGYGGDDVIYNGRWVDAGAGNDTIYDDMIDSTIFAGAGNDAIYDREGTDIVDAGSGDDFFEFQWLYYYEEDRDVVSMGTGNDIALVPLLYNGAYRTLDGGDGVDTLMLTLHSDRAGSSIMDFRPLSTGSSMVVDKVTISSFEQVYLEGTSAMKTVYFGNLNDTFIGTFGSTTVYGGGGNDYLDSGAVGNKLYGGDGDDIIVADGGSSTPELSHQAFGGNGNDWVYASYNQMDYSSHGKLSGGAGSDGFIETFAPFWQQNGDSEEDVVLDFNPAEDWIGLGIHGTRSVAGVAEKRRFEKKNYIETADKISFDITIVDWETKHFTIEYQKKTGKLVLIENLLTDWVTVEMIFKGAPKITFDNFYILTAQIGTSFNDLIEGNNSGNDLSGLGGDDVIYGHKGNDTLIGDGLDPLEPKAGNDTLNGGTGGDHMIGGGGNDTYFVDNLRDVVDEHSDQGSGTDTVRSSGSFNLGNLAAVQGSVENLVLLGSANINGTGNSLSNTLVGNSGNNAFNGGQGDDLLAGLLGNDTLIGASGYDVFLFNTALNAATNVDTIADFSVPTDTVKLENSVFTAIAGLGTLTAAQFVKNTSGTAVDASDRIIYETDTGKLFYDSNGNAAGGSIHFATLANKAAITNLDFFVV
jgi:Ca2+-binding RTX toxin-like protein